MFQVLEERLEELASEYEINIETVRKYAIMLSNSSMVSDEETFDRMLERAVSMVEPISVDPSTNSKEHRNVKDILTNTLKATFNDYTIGEINIEVDNMIDAVEEKRR